MAEKTGLIGKFKREPHLCMCVYVLGDGTMVRLLRSCCTISFLKGWGNGQGDKV